MKYPAVVENSDVTVRIEDGNWTIADQVTTDLRVTTPEHTPLSEHEPHATLQATEDGVTVTIDLSGPGLQQLAAAVQAAEEGEDADL